MVSALKTRLGGHTAIAASDFVLDAADLESIFKGYSRTIKDALEIVGMGDVQVSNNPEFVDASIFEGCLTVGLEGDFMDSDRSLMFVSSDGASYGGIPIKCFLIPPSMEGGLWADESSNATATDFFYAFFGNQVKLVHTNKPVPLDGFFPYWLWGDNGPSSCLDGYKGPESVLIQGVPDSKLSEICRDKLLTKPLLEKAGIEIPAYYTLTPTDHKKLPRVIRKFQQTTHATYFVVKGAIGDAGYYVKMFPGNQVEEAANYANQLSTHVKRVFLEKRIFPFGLKDQDNDLVDWNVRALVTVSPHPQWIDGLVRYSKMGLENVNVSHGADRANLESICSITGASFGRIKETAIAAARSIYDEVLRTGNRLPAGFVGVDIIPNASGYFVIEINHGLVGGFGSIARIKRKPVDSMRNILFKGIGPFLLENRNKRKQNPNYKRIPPTVYDYGDLANVFAEKNHYRTAVSILEHALRIFPKNADALFYLGTAYHLVGEDHKAIVAYRESIKNGIKGMDLPSLCAKMGDAFWGLSEWDSAIEAYMQVIESHIRIPEYKGCLYNLGTIFFNKKEYDKAAFFLQEFLKMHQDIDKAKENAFHMYVVSSKRRGRKAHFTAKF